MGQRRALTILVAIGVSALLVVAVLIGLKSSRSTTAPALTPEKPAGEIRVASITPAGTELVIAIGAADRLVGVSNYDDDREGTAGKPRIGDYQNIDWEKLSGLGANVLLLQYAPDRLPPFIQQRCAAMGIKIINLKLDTLDEIGRAMQTIGDAIGEADAGKRAAEELRAKLASVTQRVKGLPRVKTLVVTSDDNLGLAGPGEFLSEILEIAGGENAADSLEKPYPDVDREMIVTLSPQAVIRLAPDGDRKPQVVEQGDRIWAAMTNVPAVSNHRVYVVTAWDAEVPGPRVGELAEKFAERLHPEIASTSNSSEHP